MGYHSGAKAILRLPQPPTVWELASKATRVKRASTEHPCQAQGVASTKLQPGWESCLVPGCSSPGSGRAAAVQVPGTGVTLRARLGTSSLGQSRELQGISSKSCWLQRAAQGLCPGQGWHCPWDPALSLSSWHRVMAPALSPSPPLLVPHAARWAPLPLTPGPMEAAFPLCTMQSPLSPTFPTVSSPKSTLTVTPNRGHAPAVLLSPVPPAVGCSAVPFVPYPCAYVHALRSVTRPQRPMLPSQGVGGTGGAHTVTTPVTAAKGFAMVTLCKHTAPKQPPSHTEITPGGHRCQPPALGTCGHPTCTSPAPGHDVAPRSHPPKSTPQCRSQTPCDTPGATIGPHTWGGGTRLSCACQPGCPKQGRGCPPRGHAAVAGAGRRVPAQPLHAQGMEPFRSLPPC